MHIHHLIMSFCCWSSVLEHQQGVSLAICASALLDELVSKSSDNEDSSLDEEYRNKSSSDSSLLSVSNSSGSRSEMSEMSSVDSTSIIHDLLRIVAHAHDQMETGMEDNTIQWGKRLLIQDLSEDDALMHSCFCNAHLQKVTDKLWSRLQIFLSGNKGSIKVKNDTYSLFYETLCLLVLYRLSRPRHMRKEREGFFGLHKSKISTGITCLIHAMHALALQYLDNPAIFHNRMPYYAERVHQKCGLVETVLRLIDGTLCKICWPSLFQNSCTVVPSSATESSLSQ